MNKKFGYLSASPRISTYSCASETGPRAHILGVMNACEKLGWEANEFILGNHVPKSWITNGSQKKLSKGGYMRSLAIDLTRISLAEISKPLALNKISTDVSWVYERYASFAALGFAFKARGIPWILETNALLFQEAVIERNTMSLVNFAKEREINAYHFCDALVCGSDLLKKVIIEETDVPSKKVIVVPMGVDTEKLDPRRTKQKRFFSGFTIGYVGSLYNRQGVDLLIEVAKELRDDGLDISLVIVGDGLSYTTFKELADDLKMSSHIRFTGLVAPEEVPSYISGFDICFVGQKPLENQRMYYSPLKIYEYMAMEKPVIASAFEDARNLIYDGVTGFLYEPGDKKELKMAILRASEEAEKLPAMGQKSREIILKNHSWNARVETMFNQISDLLNNDIFNK